MTVVEGFFVVAFVVLGLTVVVVTMAFGREMSVTFLMGESNTSIAMSLT